MRLALDSIHTVIRPARGREIFKKELRKPV
jgi:hypothetical protein